MKVAGLQKVIASLNPRNSGVGLSVDSIRETRGETLLPGVSKYQDLHQGNTGASTVGGRSIVTTTFALVVVGPLQ